MLSDAATINQRIKLVLVTGWALWITVVLTTNVLDALQELNILPQGWKAHSGNFDYIDTVTARYSVPDWMDAIFIGGAIAWEGAIAVLLWRAVADLSRPRRRPAIRLRGLPRQPPPLARLRRRRRALHRLPARGDSPSHLHRPGRHPPPHLAPPSRGTHPTRKRRGAESGRGRRG